MLVAYSSRFWNADTALADEAGYCALHKIRITVTMMKIVCSEQTSLDPDVVVAAAGVVVGGVAGSAPLSFSVSLVPLVHM